MKVCVFFLVNGRRLRQLQQSFACLKKATFCTFFSPVDLREKIGFRFWLFFASQREQNEKALNNIRLFKKATKQVTVLNPFFTKRTTYSNIVSFLHGKHESGEMHESGKTTLQRWEANRQQNTFIWIHFFFPVFISSEGEVHTLNWSCSMSK